MWNIILRKMIEAVFAVQMWHSWRKEGKEHRVWDYVTAELAFDFEHQPPGCRSKAAKAALPLVFEFHCFFHRNLSLSGFKSRRTSCSQTHCDVGKNKQQCAETCRLSEVTVRQNSLNTVWFMFEYFTSLSLCCVLLITISLSPSLST